MSTDQVRGLKAHGSSPATGIRQRFNSEGLCPYEKPVVRSAREVGLSDIRARASGGQNFEQVPVRVFEIKAATAVTMIDRHVFGGTRAAAIGDAFGFDSVKDPVELRLTDLKGVMVAFELVAIIEINGQGVVDPDRREMRHRSVITEPKDPSEKPRRSLFVMGGYDRVVEMNRHQPLPS
jgi:hypothetical protein